MEVLELEMEEDNDLTGFLKYILNCVSKRHTQFKMAGAFLKNWCRKIFRLTESQDITAMILGQIIHKL